MPGFFSNKKDAKQDQERFKARNSSSFTTCPKCSHSIQGSREQSSENVTDKVTAKMETRLLVEFSPMPTLLVSSTSLIEDSNKSAQSLFSELIIEYGTLDKTHVGELGIEFPDQQWVTLGMYLERRRAMSFTWTRGEPDGQKPDDETESGTSEDNSMEQREKERLLNFKRRSSPQPSGQNTQSFFPLRKYTPGKIRRNIGKNRSRENLKDDLKDYSSDVEKLPILLRRPKGMQNTDRANNSGTGSPKHVSFELPGETRNYMLVPATLYLTFFTCEGRIYTVMSIVVQDKQESINNINTIPSPSRSPEIGNAPRATLERSRSDTIVEDLSMRVDKIRDSALENLDSLFIAFNIRGDVAVSNRNTRDFFGFDTYGTRLGQTPKEWIPKLKVFDTAFNTSSPFNEWFFHNFRKQTVAFKERIGVYINDIPKLLEISGLPLWNDSDPLLRNLDREFIGFLTVFRDVTRIKELETIHDRDEKLRAIFSSGAVAELRAPIAGIIALLQLLNESQLEAEQTTHLMGLLRSVNYLLIAIDDILDFTRLEMEPSVPTKPRSFNLCNLLSHVSNLAFHTFSEKDVQYSIDVDGLRSISQYKGVQSVYNPGATHNLEAGVECLVLADEWKLGRALTNILSNAFKYTHKGYVRLTVSVTSELDGIYNTSFEIKDTGIGISDEASKTLFKPFFSSIVSDRKTTDGLGLYVTQKIVKQMGGNVEFFSTLGIGSVFKITVPLRKGSHDLEPDSQISSAKDLLEATSTLLQQDFNERRLTSDPLSLKLPIYGEKKVHYQDASDLTTIKTTIKRSSTIEIPARSGCSSNFGSHTYTAGLDDKDIMPRSSPKSSSVAINQATVDRDLKGIKVMVVEDNWALQNITKLRLERLGCVPTVAVNGLEALRLLSSTAAQPDIILMDLQMPLMDGYDTTKAIREASDPILKQFRETPIIAFTASVADEDRERAFKVGMSDYLSKPVGMTTLSDLLHRFALRSRGTTDMVEDKSDMQLKMRVRSETL